MTSIERTPGRSIVQPATVGEWRRVGSTSRALARVEHVMLLRVARVQAEGYVQTEKMHEIDYLAREAMSGQALLAKWRDTLAGADVLLADELRFFTDVARLGKGEVIADTINTFSKE